MALYVYPRLLRSHEHLLLMLARSFQSEDDDVLTTLPWNLNGSLMQGLSLPAHFRSMRFYLGIDQFFLSNCLLDFGLNKNEFQA